MVRQTIETPCCSTYIWRRRTFFLFMMDHNCRKSYWNFDNMESLSTASTRRRSFMYGSGVTTALDQENETPPPPAPPDSDPNKTFLNRQDNELALASMNLSCRREELEARLRAGSDDYKRQFRDFDGTRHSLDVPDYGSHLEPPRPSIRRQRSAEYYRQTSYDQQASDHQTSLDRGQSYLGSQNMFPSHLGSAKPGDSRSSEMLYRSSNPSVNNHAMLPAPTTLHSDTNSDTRLIDSDVYTTSDKQFVDYCPSLMFDRQSRYSKEITGNFDDGIEMAGGDYYHLNAGKPSGDWDYRHDDQYRQEQEYNRPEQAEDRPPEDYHYNGDHYQIRYPPGNHHQSMSSMPGDSDPLINSSNGSNPKSFWSKWNPLPSWNNELSAQTLTNQRKPPFFPLNGNNNHDQYSLKPQHTVTLNKNGSLVHSINHCHENNLNFGDILDGERKRGFNVSTENAT